MEDETVHARQNAIRGQLLALDDLKASKDALDVLYAKQSKEFDRQHWEKREVLDKLLDEFE